MKEAVTIFLLILLNGVFSMAEIALISARKSRLTNEAKHGSRAARTALELANEPDRFLSTVQIGITLIGILTGLYSGDVLAASFTEVLNEWGLPLSWAQGISQPLIVVIVTYLSIVVGELVPKRIGLSAADKIAIVTAPGMYFLAKITLPFVWILSQSTALMVRLLGIRKQENKVTEEEIKSMIQEGAEAGEVQEVEQDIMERVLVLGDLKVTSIMTYRKELVCLDLSMSTEEIEQIVCNQLYESYPVIEGSLEKVVGIVTLKELILIQRQSDFCLAKAVTQPLYIPENMTVYKALEELKEKQTSRALVCDEYGSLQGIVTLKDIMTGLVGNIDNDTETPTIIKRKEGNGWLVDGQCPTYEFLDHFDRKELSTSACNSNTVGGLMLELLGHIPQEGEQVGWQGFTMEVVDMDGARIDKLLITLTDERAEKEV